MIYIYGHFELEWPRSMYIRNTCECLLCHTDKPNGLRLRISHGHTSNYFSLVYVNRQTVEKFSVSTSEFIQLIEHLN